MNIAILYMFIFACIVWHDKMILIQLTKYQATFKILFSQLNISRNFQNMVQLLEIYHATKESCISLEKCIGLQHCI